MPRSVCPPKTAVAYARYSSAGQRDVSIDQQLADIRAYAQREGYTIVHEYADHARSGFKNTSARAAFHAMIAAAEDHTFDTVLAWKVDRFGRNREDAAIYKGKLRRSGVHVVYVMEPIPDGAAGVLTEGMLEAIAQWYSENLSENVRRGMSDNAGKCLFNGSHIYGYVPGPDRHYAIEESQACVVRQIFRLYNSGHSMSAIVRMLNDGGQRTAKGKLFTLNMIRNILTQERYLGIYIWSGVRIPGGMPAIIDQQTWEGAQLMRKKTGKHYEKSPVEFLLTGKAFCGLCSSPLVGDSGTSRSGSVHYYYTCQSHKRRTGCHKKSIRKEALEDKVINFLLDYCLTGEEVEKIADAIIDHEKKRAASSPLAAMQAELRTVEKKIENINGAIAAGVWSSSTKVMLNDLEQTADSLRDSISSLQFSQGHLLDRSQVLFFLDRFRNLDRSDPEARRFLIRTFLNSVYVYDDRLLIAINAVEGNVTAPILDLPDPPPGSDIVCLGLPDQSHPNHIIFYAV